MVLILEVTISSLFRPIYTFTVTFGSPSSRVLSSVTAIVLFCFFLVFFIWPHKLRTRLLCYSQTLVMYPVFSLGPLQASKKIFGSFTCYLQSQVVTCYVLSGFRNSSLISIHIIIQLSLLSFSKYIRLRQSYEFPFILRDLRHIYQCVLRQLRTKSKTKAMIARCKFIDCVVGRKFS